MVVSGIAAQIVVTANGLFVLLQITAGIQIEPGKPIVLVQEIIVIQAPAVERADKVVILIATTGRQTAAEEMVLSYKAGIAGAQTETTDSALLPRDSLA